MSINSSSLVTYENIYTQSHANLFNLINTRSNVPLPSGLPSNHKLVYVREPKQLGRDFNGYPVIIIPSFNIDQTNKSLDASCSDLIFDISIRVWTQDKDSDSSGNPAGTEQLNSISDSILKTINANRTTLRSYGMANFKLEDSDIDYSELNGKIVYVREFVLTFKTRTKVVA